MSSKRGKQKETVEEDFEAFVRHQLSSISDDLKEMKGTQVKIQRDVESLQSQIKINESSISKLKESLDTKLEVLTGQLHESNTRIDEMISNFNLTSRMPTGSGHSRMMALPGQFWLSFCTVWNDLELSKRRGIYGIVCAFRMI